MIRSYKIMVMVVNGRGKAKLLPLASSVWFLVAEDTSLKGSKWPKTLHDMVFGPKNLET